MNLNESKALAQKLESGAPTLLRKFKRILEEQGISEVEVVSFAVIASTDSEKLITFAGTPCPTKCVLLPDGTIECKPVC